MRTPTILLCLSLAAGCDFCGPPPVTSGFDTDADGWTITGDAQTDHIEPDFDGTGGNPGGLISAVDDVAGGVWYFQAPAKYLGDQSAVFGTSLAFDLKTTDVSNPFDDEDVILTGNNDVVVAFDASPDPGVDWTSYDVPLTAAGWTLTDLEGAAATDDDLRGVLADLKQLLIRGEFNDGPDTGALDNVKLGP